MQKLAARSAGEQWIEAMLVKRNVLVSTGDLNWPHLRMQQCNETVEPNKAAMWRVHTLAVAGSCRVACLFKTKQKYYVTIVMDLIVPAV